MTRTTERTRPFLTAAIIGSILITIVVISGAAAAVDVDRGTSNQSNDWSTSTGSGVVGDGAVIYRGESGITLVDEDGSTPSPQEFERTSGPNEGAQLEINPVPNDQPVGTYASPTDDFNITVQRPRVTALAVLNDTGTDVAGGTLQADQSQAAVAVAYNYDNAEDIAVTVRDENESDVTEAIVEGSATRNGDGRIGIDPGNVEEGTYTITVEGVADLTTGNATRSVTVTIVAPGTPPTAAFEYAPDNPSIDESVTFDASGSFDPDSTGLEYRWDFDDDDVVDRTTTNPVTTYTYPDSGSYDVGLVVADEEGNTDATTREIRVRPNARCQVFPQQVAPGEDVTLDASTSGGASVVGFDTQPNGTYGQFDEEDFIVTVTYDEVGTYEPEAVAGGERLLEGVFTEGLIDTDGCGTVRVEGDNDPPEARVTGDTETAVVDESTTFDAGASADPDGRIVEYRWDFNDDGSVDRTTSDPVTSYTYSEPGSYDVRLTVVDEAGDTDTTQLSVQVDSQSNLPPIWVIAVGGGAGFLLWRNAGKIIDRRSPDTDTDGSDGDESDDDGSNRPPIARASYVPLLPKVNRPVLFDGSLSADPDPNDQVVSYRWTIEDSEDGEDRTLWTPRVVHVFGEAGDYEVTLAVTDRHGAAKTWSKSISVEGGSGELALDDVDPNPPGDDHQHPEDEYVVFRNVGESTLELAGWTVHDAAEEEGRVRPGEHTFEFGEGTTLEPEERVALHTGDRPDEGAEVEGPADSRHFFWGKSRAIWNNDEDLIVVRDDDGSPALARRYLRTDSGEYELEGLDMERLISWFPDVDVSDSVEVQETGFSFDVGVDALSAVRDFAAGALFLRGPGDFLVRWGITAIVIVAWLAIAVRTEVSEPIVPLLLVLVSLFMLFVGLVWYAGSWLVSRLRG